MSSNPRELEEYGHPTTDELRTLIQVLATDTHQARHVGRIVRSIWNGYWQVGLYDELGALDRAIDEALLALIRSRMHLGNGADKYIERVLQDSGEMRRLCAEVDRLNEEAEKI